MSAAVVGELDVVRDRLSAIASSFDPASVPVDEVVSVFQVVDQIARSAASLQLLLAARVDASERWRAAGYASAAEFLAATSGSTVADARTVLASSSKLAELPVVQDALRSGKLSSSQAALVSDAASSAPDQQARLVREAQRTSVRELKSQCLRTKAAADPNPDATYQHIHSDRHFRAYVDREGAWNAAVRATADTGARIEVLMRPFIDAEFDRARTDGRRESYDAYALDAFLRMCEEAGPRAVRTDDDTAPRGAAANRPPLRSLAILRVDLPALVRGAVQPDENCEIAGVGPVPVSIARRVLGESILKLVVTNGDAVRNVTHLGRGPTTAQRVALLWEQPLCSVEGCHRTRCDIDHSKPWAKTHHTRLDELDHLCRPHHDNKTRHGWALVDGTGKHPWSRLTTPTIPTVDHRHERLGRARGDAPAQEGLEG